MGVTVSRDFSDAVASCVSKGSSLESLLEDPEVVNPATSLSTWLTDIQFVRRWKTSYQALPPQAPKNLEGLARQQPQESREERKDLFLKGTASPGGGYLHPQRPQTNLRLMEAT